MGVVFYETRRGEKPALEFLRELPTEARAKCGAYLRLLQEQDRLPSNYARPLEGDLWELRPEWGGTEYRLLYFRDGREIIVVVHAFAKKTQRTPRTVIDAGLARMADYRARKAEAGREK